MVSWLNEVLSLGVPTEVPEDGFLPLFAHIAQHWQLSMAQSMSTYGFAQLENMVLAAVKTVPLGQMAGQRILWQLQSKLSAQVDTLSDRVHRAFEGLTTAQEIVDTLVASEEHVCQRLCQDLYKSLNISNNLPNLAILSSMHEEQYSRLFRS
jgi:urease accessory protein